MACVKDLMSLESLRGINLVAGSGGLYHPVSWPNFVVTEESRYWLAGNDIILMTGVGLPVSTEHMIHQIEEAIIMDSACIIYFLHPDHIKEIPEAVINFAEEKKFAIFSAPWYTRFVDVIRDVSALLLMEQYQEEAASSLLEELLSGDGIPSNALREFIRIHHISGDYAVAIAKFTENARMTDRQACCNQIIREIGDAFPDTMHVSIPNGLCFLVRIDDNSVDSLYQEAQRLSTDAFRRWSNLEIYFGIGRVYSDPFMFHRSRDEAEKAWRQCSQGQPVVSFSRLGLYQLLMEVPDQNVVREFSLSVLRPILDYDRANHRSLQQTLEAYLECNCNIAQTAQALFMHRNTLTYQLDKIQELLCLDLGNAQDRLLVNNALALYRYSHK